MPRHRLGVIVVALACGALAWTLPAVAHHSATSGGTINVTAGKPGEFKFTISKKSVTKGAVTFFVSNKGALSHDFKISGKKTKMIKPGQSTTLKVAFTKAGSFPYMCTVSGHAAAGMKGTLKVT